ncbi:hypothetical protein CGRA01v4_07144 [Colletotrichum graminicola]|nr:hypothetical protein CGRA01v4_07144 [Colletotrichum graminicola]
MAITPFSSTSICPSAPWKKESFHNAYERDRDETCPHLDTESRSGCRWQTTSDPPNTYDTVLSPAATVRRQMRRGTW